MRVIAGEARGRRIDAPTGTTTRPITDRAKEAIFNMLTSLGGVDGAQVLDLYAGSGSFGIECLSRGAARATFVERDRRAAAVIEANLDRLGFADRATVLVGEVVGIVPTSGPVDVAFCDPPYADDPWPKLLPSLDATLLVAHTERELALAPPWTELRRRRYGRSHIVIADRTGDEPPSDAAGLTDPLG